MGQKFSSVETTHLVLLHLHKHLLLEMGLHEFVNLLDASNTLVASG